MTSEKKTRNILSIELSIPERQKIKNKAKKDDRSESYIVRKLINKCL